VVIGGDAAGMSAASQARRRQGPEAMSIAGSWLLLWPAIRRTRGARLAVAPGYPQAATVGVIACSPDDADHRGRAPDPGEERVVWIGEGTQLGYLPETARSALGHGWT